MPSRREARGVAARRPLRVALDIRILQGEDARRGIGNYTRGLAEALGALADGGLEVVHLIDGRAGEPASDGCRAQARIDIGEFRRRGPLARLGGSPDARALARAAERCGAVVLLVCSPLHGPFDWRAMRRGATVATFYDLIPLVDASHFIDRWPERARRRYLRRLAALRKIDRLFAISRVSAQEAERIAGFDARRIGVFYPALRSELERLAAPRHPTAHSSAGEPGGYILGFASMNPSKNTEALLRGFALLEPGFRREHGLVLCAANDAALAERVRGLARELGISGEIDLREGSQSDEGLAALYSGAALFVLPSTLEGFGLPALEAMAFGAPVAASDIPVLREVLDKAGVYFDPYDPASIARTIAETLKDGALRARMREAGRIGARRFSWRETAQRALETYESLARR
jgi:glycosyltransferase involved in cell wall biosynthesis